MQHLRTTFRSSQVDRQQPLVSRGNGAEARLPATLLTMSLTISKPAVPSVARIGSTRVACSARLAHHPPQRHVVQDLVDRPGRQHGPELEQISLVSRRAGRIGSTIGVSRLAENTTWSDLPCVSCRHWRYSTSQPMTTTAIAWKQPLEQLLAEELEQDSRSVEPLEPGGDRGPDVVEPGRRHRNSPFSGHGGSRRPDLRTSSYNVRVGEAVMLTNRAFDGYRLPIRARMQRPGHVPDGKLADQQERQGFESRDRDVGDGKKTSSWRDFGLRYYSC